MKTTLLKFSSLLMLAAMTFSSCSIESTDDEDSGSSTVQGLTVSGKSRGYSYVDLGLSVKWATYNLGGSKPSDCGDYYAWAETSPKESYKWANYKYGTQSEAVTKYGKRASQGVVDNLTTLESSDDAIAANWGGEWRMPTDVELNELMNGCTWEWISDFENTGMSGLKGTSKKNGNTIFLPSAGDSRGTSLTTGYYWSSTLGTNSGAGLLIVIDKNTQNDEIDYTRDADRAYGRSVRGVIK